MLDVRLVQHIISTITNNYRLLGWALFPIVLMTSVCLCLRYVPHSLDLVG